MYENFKYLDAVAQKEITKDVFSGSVLSVIHKGETVYLKSFGLADKEKNIPMKTDSIFRLFSMSKPVTAVAAMILIERGLLDTRHLLKWFIPEFSDPVVLDENGEHPADRDITIGDLLTMTSGIPYPDGTPAGQKMGALWGEQSEKYLKGEKLLDTVSFAKEKYSRLAQCYEYKNGGNEPFTHFHLCLTDYTVPPAFESGGAGLVSTAEDYAKFAKMLMNKGELDGMRILGRNTVDFMTRNGLTPEQRKTLNWDSTKGHGYGNFMRILDDPSTAGLIQSEGSFGWDGWMGCYFSLDPKEQLCILYFIQQTGAGTTDSARRLQNIAWGAVK